MTLELRRPAALAGILVSAFAGLVAALLWLMPRPFTRFEYLIAGTAATALTLLLLLLLLTPGAMATFRRMLRQTAAADPARLTVPETDQPAGVPRMVRRTGQS